MTTPKTGTIFRYAYLWADEAESGLEEGKKDRPALVVAVAISQTHVVALAITHTKPNSTEDAISLPMSVKRQLGLDDTPSWIVLTEANVFAWPGPDIRNIPGTEPPTSIYGRIPNSLLQTAAQRILENRKRQRMRIVSRTK